MLLKDNPEDETLLSLKNDLVKVIELTQGLSKLRESKKAVEDAYQEKKDEKVIGQRCMAQRQGTPLLVSLYSPPFHVRSAS